MKYDLKKDKIAIHCSTEEISEQVIEALINNNFLTSGAAARDLHWKVYKHNTCFNVAEHMVKFSSVMYYSNIDYEVISAEEYLKWLDGLVKVDRPVFPPPESKTIDWEAMALGKGKINDFEMPFRYTTAAEPEAYTVEYDSESKQVTYTTSKGIEISCITPANWTETRVFQFMEAFVKSVKTK